MDDTVDKKKNMYQSIKYHLSQSYYSGSLPDGYYTSSYVGAAVSILEFDSQFS